MTTQTANRITRLTDAAAQHGYFIDDATLDDGARVIRISPAAFDLGERHDEITVTVRDGEPLTVQYWPRRTYYPMHRMTRREQVIGAKRITLRYATEMVDGEVLL